MVNIIQKIIQRRMQPTPAEQRMQMSRIDRGYPQTSLVVPFAGAISRLPTVARGAYAGGKAAIKAAKAIQNQPIKSFVTKLALTVGAYGLGQYAATGKIPDPSLRTAAGIAGFKLNPFASVAGGASGLFQEAVDKGKNFISRATGDAIQPVIPGYNFSPMSGYPNLSPAVNITSPAAPSFVFNQAPGPSFSPGGFSFSVPGIMGGGISPAELALLAAALGGGFLLGRRRRKKKKYKKRRSG